MLSKKKFIKRIVESKGHQTFVITGSPGSGKTTLIKEIIKESNLPLDKILVLSPGKEVAQKNQKEVMGLFNMKPSKNNPKVGRTIFSHGLEMTGGGVDSIYFRQPKTEIHQKFHLSRVLKNYKFESEHEKQKIVAYASEYEKLKDGRSDFTDLLIEPLASSTDTHHELVFLDEMQNSNYWTFNYLEKIFPNATIVIVGDEHQTILSFGGSDKELNVEIVKKIRKLHNGENYFRLQLSHRFGSNIRNSIVATLGSRVKIDKNDFQVDSRKDRVLRYPSINLLKIRRGTEWIFTARDDFILEKKVLPFLQQQELNFVYLKSKTKVHPNLGDPYRFDGNPHDPELIKVGNVWQVIGAEATNVVVMLEMSKTSFYDAKYTPILFDEAVSCLYTMKSRAKLNLFLITSTTFGFEDLEEMVIN